MGRKTRRRSTSSMPKQSWVRRHTFSVALILIIVATLGGVCFNRHTSSSNQPDRPDTLTVPVPTRVAAVKQAFTLDRLLAMTPGELAGVDIAEMNLLCASGLPGAETLDIGYSLATLDKWADRVRIETNRHLYRIIDPRYADHYHHSEAYLRAEFVLQTIQEDLGVRYNLAAKDHFTFNDSRVAFLHGMVPGPGQTVASMPGGTCASMPVLYVAVGRRLGYPLRLVTAKGHLFARWDGKDHPNPAWRERFNIEGTNGFVSYPDDYYKTWPIPSTELEVRANRYLLSLSPAEELAEFLALRGHSLADNHSFKEAIVAYAAAHQLAPTVPAYLAWMKEVEDTSVTAVRVTRQPRVSEPPLVSLAIDPVVEAAKDAAIRRAAEPALPLSAPSLSHRPESLLQPGADGEPRLPSGMMD